MDRPHTGIIILALGTLLLAPIHAQEAVFTPRATTPDSTPATGTPPTKAPNLKPSGATNPPPPNTQIDREKVRANLEKWKSLPTEEQEAIRIQAKKRREQAEQSVDEFIKKNGWTLEPEQRARLLERFVQERLKIERTLRQEMEEKRRPLIKEMRERLKAEFSPAASSPSP